MLLGVANDVEIPDSIPSTSTRSPFLSWMSRRAQSDRRTSYRETGVVHRITFSFSDFLFLLMFYLSIILDIK